MAPAKPHVLIIGAGVGGLFFAQILRKKNVSFEIFDEASSEKSDAGFWPKILMLHSVVQSFDALLPDDLPPYQQLEICSPLGLTPQIGIYLGENPRMGVGHTTKTPFLHVRHLELQQWLSTHLAIQRGKKATKLDEVGDVVVVTFEDGTSATGDVVVGADGVDSFVRQSLLGEDKSQWLEGMGIAGSAILSGDDLVQQLELGSAASIMPTRPDPTFDVMWSAITEVLPDGKSALYTWQLGGYEAGPQRKEADMAPDALREKALELTKLIDPRGRRIIELTPADKIEGCFYYKDANIEEIPAGRITLIGDAAHTCAPFKGDGAVQAFRDGIRLGNSIALLESTDKDALIHMTSEYHNEMIPRGVAAVRAGKGGLSEYTNMLSRPRVFGSRLVLMPEEKLALDPAGGVRVL
ncbi:salicylate hydroxylase [Microdochium nivale]|nr:salicylate hydroxylase [Microdochium nivale]